VAAKADRAIPYVKEWNGIYLADAQKRLNTQLHGLTLTIEDAYTLQQVSVSKYEVRMIFD
jgi:hypothetical protein